jgi:hypothetical protein
MTKTNMQKFSIPSIDKVKRIVEYKERICKECGDFCVTNFNGTCVFCSLDIDKGKCFHCDKTTHLSTNNLCFVCNEKFIEIN